MRTSNPSGTAAGWLGHSPGVRVRHPPRAALRPQPPTSLCLPQRLTLKLHSVGRPLLLPNHSFGLRHHVRREEVMGRLMCRWPARPYTLDQAEFIAPPRRTPRPVASARYGTRRDQGTSHKPPSQECISIIVASSGCRLPSQSASTLPSLL